MYQLLDEDGQVVDSNLPWLSAKKRADSMLRSGQTVVSIRSPQTGNVYSFGLERGKLLGLELQTPSGESRKPKWHTARYPQYYRLRSTELERVADLEEDIGTLGAVWETEGKGPKEYHPVGELTESIIERLDDKPEYAILIGDQEQTLRVGRDDEGLFVQHIGHGKSSPSIERALRRAENLGDFDREYDTLQRRDHFARRRHLEVVEALRDVVKDRRAKLYGIDTVGITGPATKDEYIDLDQWREDPASRPRGTFEDTRSKRTQELIEKSRLGDDIL